MPEGPEIRRAADRVAAAIAGKIAYEVFFAFDRLKPFEGELTGQRVSEVTTRGKGMLTRFEGGLSVYTHNQLYGRWYVMREGRLPKTGRQLRFSVGAGDRRALLYSASEIEVLDAQDERAHPYLSRLGPDVLSEAPNAAELAARLDEPRFRGRQLAALLLDQGFVAGLGNYLRAEILFEARIHPRRRSADCAESERTRLADRIIALTKRTYRTRGITLGPSRVAALKASGAPRSAYRFWVYGRAGNPCRVCEQEVEVQPIGGRKCFWCPSCQPGANGNRSAKGSAS
jgi:endonuclease-8